MVSIQPAGVQVIQQICGFLLVGRSSLRARHLRTKLRTPFLPDWSGLRFPDGGNCKRDNVSSSSLLQKMPLRETTTATREPWAPLYFSTKSMPKAEQFGGWRDFVAATVELTLVDAPIEGFEAEQDIWNIDDLVLASARMPGRGYVRSWHHLTRDPLDHWCLVLCEGATPGTRGPLSFRSLARPFFGGGADERVLTLFVPRDLFASRSSAFNS